MAVSAPSGSTSAIPGDPGAIHAQADALAKASSTAERALTHIDDGRDTALRGWRGSAADAFEGHVEQQRKDVQKNIELGAKAAPILHTYADVLQIAQSKHRQAQADSETSLDRARAADQGSMEQLRHQQAAAEAQDRMTAAVETVRAANDLAAEQIGALIGVDVKTSTGDTLSAEDLKDAWRQVEQWKGPASFVAGQSLNAAVTAAKFGERRQYQRQGKPMPYRLKNKWEQTGKDLKAKWNGATVMYGKEEPKWIKTAGNVGKGLGFAGALLSMPANIHDNLQEGDLPGGAAVLSGVGQGLAQYPVGLAAGWATGMLAGALLAPGWAGAAAAGVGIYTGWLAGKATNAAWETFIEGNGKSFGDNFTNGESVGGSFVPDVHKVVPDSLKFWK